MCENGIQHKFQADSMSKAQAPSMTNENIAHSQGGRRCQKFHQYSKACFLKLKLNAWEVINSICADWPGLLASG